jgi:hypothetical protein
VRRLCTLDRYDFVGLSHCVRSFSCAPPDMQQRANRLLTARSGRWNISTLIIYARLRLSFFFGKPTLDQFKFPCPGFLLTTFGSEQVH